MVSRYWLWAGALLILPALCRAQDTTASQVEQARQFESLERTAQDMHAPAEEDSGVSAAPVDAGDDSFGDQQILKNAPRIRPFDIYGAVSEFFTNNVALTQKEHHADSFLAANFGLSATRTVAENLQLQLNASAGILRYARYNAFDLDSTDVGIGVAYQLPRLWDSTAYLQYDYDDLFNGQGGHEFFSSHSVLVGLQKIIAIDRAQNVSLGVDADFNFSTPVALQRDEYSAFADYHADLTHYLAGDLLYRYGYQQYSELGRYDNNQSVQLSVRYAATAWLELLFSLYFTMNRSNYRIYDYNGLEGGVGANANVRF
jgi:hypothetical protein